MIHMLRNTLDHGIEKPSERILKKKAEKGRLEIEASYVEDRVVLKIRDDGRGLAISRLRALGLKQGLISEASSLQEIAETIFVSGISTAEKVSNISGRGVGMEAVRSYLNEVGASISVRLLDAKDEQADFYDFFFEIELPLAFYDAA